MNEQEWSPATMVIACIELMQEEAPHEVTRSGIDDAKLFIRCAAAERNVDLVEAAGRMVEGIILSAMSVGEVTN